MKQLMDSLVYSGGLIKEKANYVVSRNWIFDFLPLMEMIVNKEVDYNFYFAYKAIISLLNDKIIQEYLKFTKEQKQLVKDFSKIQLTISKEGLDKDEIKISIDNTELRTTGRIHD